MKRSQSAFTLLELLAAIAILALLSAVIFGIFGQASRAWTASEARTETFQSARIALDLLSRELATAVATNTTSRSGNNVKITFLTYEDSSYAASDIDPGNNLDRTPPNDAIFFVGTGPDTQGPTVFDTDLIEYGYFVAWANDDAYTFKKQRYYLFRHEIDSRDASNSQRPLWDFFRRPTDWWTTPPIGTGVKTPILDNVLRFELRYEYGSGGTYGTEVAERWDTCGTTPTYPACASVPDPMVRLPRAVHIRLGVLDRRFATRLAAIRPNGLTPAELALVPYDPAGNTIESLSNEPLKNLLREGLRMFYRTVYLRNAS